MNLYGIKRLQPVRNRFGAFISWWKSELAGMAPSFMRHGSHSAEHLLLALFKDDAVTFFSRDSSLWRELGRSRIDSPQPEIDNDLQGFGNKKYVTIARLPGASILRRRLELPIAAENELRRILSYQLDSLSPYPPEQVCFSFRILERDYAARTLVIELYLTPKEKVDKLVGKMRAWNLVPDFVDFVDQDELAEPEVNLLPSPLAPVKQHSLFSAFNKLLLAVNALLAVAFVAVLLITRSNVEAELKTRVETAKLKADAAIRLRDKVKKLQAESSFLQDTKRQRPPVLEVIDELTVILPDQTWLEKAVYHKNEISLSGISSKASVLISEIERSPLFENAAFQASVVQDDRLGGERFQIRADITGADERAE
ncbi:MAG: PilN domain-containing protein [Gammaproteobacteria bacterium]|nr:PilN domain-containing protein [Gammaproteobacteria bacterium]